MDKKSAVPGHMKEGNLEIVAKIWEKSCDRCFAFCLRSYIYTYVYRDHVGAKHKRTFGNQGRFGL